MSRFKFAENVCWKCQDAIVHVDGPKCSECGSPVPKPKAYLSVVVLIMSLLAFIVLPATIAFAGPAESVAVAEAIIWAAQHAEPALDAGTFQTVPPRAKPDESTPPKPVPDDIGRLETELSAARKDLAEKQETVTSQAWEINQLRLRNKVEQPSSIDRNGTSNPINAAVSLDLGGGFSNQQPVRIEFAQTGGPISEPIPRAQLVIESTKGCAPCNRLEREIEHKLKPLDWQIGTSPSDQIRFVEGTDNTTYPRITLYKNGAMAAQWHGYQSTEFLSNELLKAWGAASEPAQGAYLASGSAGAIHAKQQIRDGLNKIRQYIGEGIPVSMSWDRNGASSLPLLARGEWTALKLYGNSGHIQIDAHGAKGLPVDQIGFGYRLRGNDIELDADPVLFEGMTAKLEPNPKQVAGVNPVGVFVIDDMVTAWTIFSSIRGIMELFWPSVDVLLPGQIAGQAVLNGDTLTVNFTQPVTVKAQMLFTFNLVVQKLVISESNIHVEFSGSRFVKSRDFQVQ